MLAEIKGMPYPNLTKWKVDGKTSKPTIRRDHNTQKVRIPSTRSLTHEGMPSKKKKHPTLKEEYYVD